MKTRVYFLIFQTLLSPAPFKDYRSDEQNVSPSQGLKKCNKKFYFNPRLQETAPPPMVPLPLLQPKVPVKQDLPRFAGCWE